jgi:hypothetical protein
MDPQEASAWAAVIITLSTAFERIWERIHEIRADGKGLSPGT